MNKTFRTVILYAMVILMLLTSCNDNLQKLEEGSVNEYIYPYIRFDKSDDGNSATAIVLAGAKLNTVRIPASFDGIKVNTFIGFENPDDAKSVKEIVIGSNDTVITDEALKDAINLEQVKVEKTSETQYWGKLPVLDREGYEFLGWFAGDVLIHEGMPMDSDSKVAVPRWREHVYIEHEGKAPTCTEPGWKPYRTCADCDYTDYEEIPALGHAIVEVEAKKGDCIEDGILHHWKCTRCGSVFSDSEGKYEIDPDSLIVEAPGKHALVHVDEIRATCSDTGIGEYWYCSVCGKTFADENGNVEKDITIIPKLPHTFTDEWHKDDKYHWHECSVCGEADLKVAHTWSEEVLKDPTPTEKGQKRVYCDICGKSYLEDIMPTGHEYEVVKVIAPTCTERGYTLYLDKVTGEQFKGDYADPLGHSLQFVEEVPSTCTVHGKKAHYHCNICGHDFTSETGNIEIDELDLPLADHTYVRKHDSYHHWDECTVCGDVKDKVAHTLIAEPKYQKSAATCKDYAVYYKYCDCGFVSNETFEYVEGGYADHKLTHVEKIEATCTEPGLKEHWICRVCGKVFADSEGNVEVDEAQLVVDALGHVFEDNAWHVENGRHYPICSRCHEAIGEGEPHEAEWVTDAENHWKRCKVCHHVLSEKSPHEFIKVGEDIFCKECHVSFDDKPDLNPGGFEIKENTPPKGILNSRFLGNGVWRISFVKDRDSSPVETYQWIFEGVELVGEQGSSVVVKADRPESYQIECLVRNEYGLGFATLMITGK